MKKIIIGAIAGIALLSTVAFKTMYETKKGTAEVTQNQGIYVFTDCKPVQEYDYLGTAKGSFLTKSATYPDVRDDLIKNGRKEFPNADGFILDLSKHSEKCDAIKFK